MKFKTKGFISLLLACAFSVAAFSGVILYMTPRGRVANWSGWTMLGLDKHGWSALHINACLLMLIIVAWHLLMNWKVFWSYIRKRSAGLNLKLEMATAVVVTAALIAGTIYEVPPLTTLMAWNEDIKNSWEQQAPQGPAPHAEEFTLARFASNVGVDLNEMVVTLEKEGLTVADTEMTVARLAEQNGLVPSEVYSLMSRNYPQLNETANAGRGGGRGAGRGMGRGGEGQAGGACDDPNCGETGTSGAGCPEGEGRSCEANSDAQSHGTPGSGMGPGRGLGPGRGMGQGRGMGRGMGLGRGMGAGHGDGPEGSEGGPQPQQ